MSRRAATGRAGRLRLRHQLGTAHRAAELLDRKQRVLAAEVERLERNAGRTGAEWLRAAREAATWLGRCAALDGQHGLSAAAPLAPTAVDVEVADSMGVSYPVRASVTFSGERTRPGSSALVFATESHRSALAAAVRHAAATRAVAVLTAELTETRARQRAIDNRWIPRLEEDLHALEARLDELDREENLRLHWAADNGPASPS